MKRMLAIWLPNWPVQRFMLARPELADRPIVLYEKHPRYGAWVKACSGVAMDRGVRPGMPLAEASALVRPHAPDSSCCDQPHVAPHDVAADRKALEKLAEWCQRFSPIVGRADADEPEGLLLEVGGVASLFGGERSLVWNVADALQQRVLAARIAIADTPGAAWAVARFADGRPAARTAGFSCQIIPPGDLQALDHLPVAALRLPARIAESLHRLGIREIGQLRNLPRASLATRFGAGVLRRLDQIAGAVPDAIVAHRPAVELAAHWDFEYPSTHPGAIEHGVRHVLQELSRRLIGQGQGVLRLECRLACQGRRPIVMDIGLYQPVVEWQHLLALVALRLDRCFLPGAVEAIQVRAVETAPRLQRQGTLFAGRSREEPAPLGHLIERLSSRLGRNRVVRAHLEPDAAIQRAYRYAPWTGRRPSAERTGSRSVSRPLAAQGGAFRLRLGPMVRPLRVFDPPRPVQVVGIAQGGPPAMFFYRRRRYRVARWFGPERIETGWWRGPSSRRDYYRVETETGSRMWLFRRLPDGKWFLQGEFI